MTKRLSNKKNQIKKKKKNISKKNKKIKKIVKRKTKSSFNKKYKNNKKILKGGSNEEQKKGFISDLFEGVSSLFTKKNNLNNSNNSNTLAGMNNLEDINKRIDSIGSNVDSEKISQLNDSLSNSKDGDFNNIENIIEDMKGKNKINTKLEINYN